MQAQISSGEPPIASSEPRYAGLWNAAVHSDRGRRWQSEVDLAFWRQKAQSYDGGQVAVPNTLRAVADHLHPHQTLLDVGAGTGRFALPLARCVQSVTALDHSQAMLDVLSGKVQGNKDRIETVCGSLEHHALPRHDVVLAAWALYRCTDLDACLTRLLGLSRQTLMIVDDDGAGSPHRQFRRNGQAALLPRATTLAGALRQLGVLVEVQLIAEGGRLWFTDAAHCLSSLGMGQADLAEQARFLNHLKPYLHESGGELVYRWPFTVSLIVVQTGTESTG